MSGMYVWTAGLKL